LVCGLACDALATLLNIQPKVLTVIYHSKSRDLSQ
jgi:hypothetical protein